MRRRKGTMLLAPTRKYISPKKRIYFCLTNRKVPCAGKDFFDNSSLLAHDTLHEVGSSIVRRCRPGGQHIRIPPNSKRVWRASANFRYDKAAHQKHRFFYSVGVSYLYPIKIEPMICEVTHTSSALRLCVWLFDDSYLQILNIY